MFGVGTGSENQAGFPSTASRNRQRSFHARRAPSTARGALQHPASDPSPRALSGSAPNPRSNPNPHSNNHPEGQEGAARPLQWSCSHLGSLVPAVFPLCHLPLGDVQGTWGQTPTLAVPWASRASTLRPPLPQKNHLHSPPVAEAANQRGQALTTHAGRGQTRPGCPELTPKPGAAWAKSCVGSGTDRRSRKGKAKFSLRANP